MYKFKTLLLTIALLASLSLSADLFTVKVNIQKLKPAKGMIRIAICNSEANYKAKGIEAFKSTVKPVVGETTVITFKDIPAGDYAVKVIHDEDSNGTFNTNFIGMPIEGFAFSNDAKGHFGAPDFEDVKFKVAKDTTIVVNIRKL